MKFELDYNITYELTTLRAWGKLTTSAIPENRGVYYKIRTPSSDTGVNNMVIDFTDAADKPTIYGKHDSRPGWLDSNYHTNTYPYEASSAISGTSHDEYFLLRGGSGGSDGGKLAVYFECGSGSPIPMSEGYRPFSVAPPFPGIYSFYVSPDATGLTITAPYKSGASMTVKKPDGSSGAVTTQDDKYTYGPDNDPASGCWTVTLSSSAAWAGNLTAALSGPAVGAAVTEKEPRPGTTHSYPTGTMSAELQVIAE